MSISTPAEYQTKESTRRAHAAALLERWIEEYPAYDARVAEVLEDELAQGGMKCEDRDETGS